MDTTAKETTLRQKFNKIDNRFTFIIGYRNLFNIAVMFISTWFVVVNPSEFSATAAPSVYIGAFILLVMSMKWFLTQIRDNIDSSDVRDLVTEE